MNVQEYQKNGQRDIGETHIRWERVILPQFTRSSDFQKHKLENDASCLKVVRNRDGKTASKFFIFLGTAITLGCLIVGFLATPYLFFGCGFGLLFVLLGVRDLYFTQSSTIFDKASGYFRHTTGKINNLEEIVSLEENCKISHVVAVQTLRKDVDVPGEISYVSFELNIVLKNGKRLNVMDEGGSREENIAEAQKLADFLGVPAFAGNEA